MITIAETGEYRKKATVLLPEEDHDALKAYLAEHPKAGVIMEGTGGVRKLRWAIPGKGKSGGARVIYFYHDDDMPLYMLTMFGKNEKSNLTKKERNDLKDLVQILVKLNK